ncbi:MAG: hypothetical protein ACK51S_08615 [Alphaproteobacteria bacterium]
MSYVAPVPGSAGTLLGGVVVAADRIQARAIRRCGELLRQIPQGQGARDGKRQEGDLPPLTRTEAAPDAGLSEHQRKTALRVAAIPEPEFTQAVESDAPPTVTALAERGRQARPQLEADDAHTYPRTCADIPVESKASKGQPPTGPAT